MKRMNESKRSELYEYDMKSQSTQSMYSLFHQSTAIRIPYWIHSCGFCIFIYNLHSHALSVSMERMEWRIKTNMNDKKIHTHTHPPSDAADEKKYKIDHQ